MVKDLCVLFLEACAVYFILVSASYVVLMLLSWVKIKRYQKTKVCTEKVPAVSFIIPAFNEESLIVETIQTYLSLKDAEKEIIVINDGSHDQTFRMLQIMFQLRRLSPESSAFRSITYPELTVLQAPHFGKAQALNFGVAHAKFDLICTMDADTIPTAEGVEACLKAFAQDPQLVAAGGVIQLMNKEANKLVLFQRLEYLRTFLCERLGWSYLGSTFLISGAFCMVKKEAIRKVGGFRRDSITEDLDLIIRLRRAYQKIPSRFKILPVTTCYTQVPQDKKHLMVQRIRWQMGLVQTLGRHIDLFAHPAYRFLGMVAIPYAWLVEAISPVITFLTFITVPTCLIMGWIDVLPVIALMLAGLFFNISVTLLGVHLDETYVSKKTSWTFSEAVLGTTMSYFGYKQLTSWWRLLALFRVAKKKYEWGEKPRQEIIRL